MSYSYTFTETTTFTATHAKHMAAKVAADLKRIQRFYDNPSDTDIDAFETEVIELLKKGYLATVTYGFYRNGNWIEPTLRYTSQELGVDSADDNDPGRVRPGADIDGASFYSYLTYTSAWGELSVAEKEAFKRNLPFQRQGADEPGVTGYMLHDRTYSSGGRALNRESVRSH